MTTPFQITRRVEFHDTDQAGIMHFTGYFRLMEAAEHAFLRQHGLNVFMEDATGKISWPRVSASCDFRAPGKFSDELAIQVTLDQLGESSVTYRFEVFRDQDLLATGSMTSVCCRLSDSEPPQSIPIPEPIRAKLSAP